MIGALSLLACVPGRATGSGGSGAAVDAQVEAVARELVVGIADGEWAPWERRASEELLYTTEFGRTMTKRELQAIFKPVPPVQQRTLTMHVVGVRTGGDAAVLVYELRARKTGALCATEAQIPIAASAEPGSSSTPVATDLDQ